MAGFPGQQLVTYLYLGMIGPQHYATPENKYRDTFFNYIPQWLVPGKEADDPAIEWAFYGLPPGKDLPWHEWIGPLLVWTPYLLALLGLHLCTAALLRRRWAEDEHMLFPLARVPVEMISYDSDRARFPAIFRHWLAWVFFLIPVIMYSKNALHYYFPAIPETDLTKDIGYVFTGRPWNRLNYLPYYLYFEMMGVAYLIADDIGFSLWFFWLFRRFMIVGREAAGLTGHQDFFTQQGYGGYILLAVIYLWYARHSFRDIVRKALWGAADVDDSGEPMPYRVSFWGFVACLAAIFLWGRVAGAQIWPLVPMFLLYLVSLTVLTRLVAEAGLFAVWTPLASSHQVVVDVLHSSTVGARNITIMSYMGWKIQDTASCTMANIMQGYKVADLARLRVRAACGLAVAALVVALFASHPPSLYAIYSHTVPALGWWPRNAGAGLGRTIQTLIEAPKEFTLGNYGNIALGAAVVYGLHLMRGRFAWWPFHPLAYAALNGPQFMGDRYGFSILVGWVVRKLVHRFGGYKAYLLFRYAAVGIIAGNAVVLLFWTIVHYFHPIPGVLIIE